MMRTKSILFFFLLCCFTGTAQIYQFQKLYGTGGIYMSYDLRCTTDGGYVVAGLVQDTLSGSFKNLVFKTDAAGALEWKRTYSAGGEDLFQCVEQANDGGYVLAGYTSSNLPPGQYGVYIVKTDSLGNVQWSQTLTGIQSAFAYAIKKTSDGNYILAGGASDTINGTKAMLVKIGSAGNLMWANRYGSPGTSKEYAFDIVESNDGGYVAVGYTISYGAGNTDMYVVKTDVAGNLLWTKAYGGAQAEVGYAISKVNNENSFLISGYSNSYSSNYYSEGALLKIDSTGNLLWSKMYNESSTQILTMHGMVQSADNSIAMLGMLQDINTGDYKYCLVRTDAAGNVVSSKKYGYAQWNEGVKIRETPFLGFMLAGASYTNTLGQIYLIKTDSLGNSGCNEMDGEVVSAAALVAVDSGGVRLPFGNELPQVTLQDEEPITENALCFIAGININTENHFSVSVFPNPFTNAAEISSDHITANCTLTLYDVFGNEVQHSKAKYGSVRIEREDLSAGIYFWKIFSGQEEIANGKIIAQ